MDRIAKKTKRYPSDLTDKEWGQIAPLMTKPGRRGRPREVDFREVINSVRYLVRSGYGWRMPPIHFGPWQTVYGWIKTIAGRKSTKFRGRERVGWAFTFSAAGYNLVRLPKLIAETG
jgi:transposase